MLVTMNRKKLVSWLLLAALLAWVGMYYYLKVGVWQECRQTNSLFYCLQLMSDK